MVFYLLESMHHQVVMYWQWMVDDCRANHIHEANTGTGRELHAEWCFRCGHTSYVTVRGTHQNPVSQVSHELAFSLPVTSGYPRENPSVIISLWDIVTSATIWL